MQPGSRVAIAADKPPTTRERGPAYREVVDSERTPFGSYGQLCPVAAGSDAVAERWTLLLLRDLAQTPLRFSELAASNPGISPSVLTNRLNRLEQDGVIEVITAERTAQKRYQLRDSVRGEVLGLLDAVSRLGVAVSPPVRVTAEQLVEQFEMKRAWFLAKHHRTNGEFALHLDEVTIGLSVSQFSFEPSLAVPTEPTATVTCSLETMLTVNATKLRVRQAIKAGLIEVEGDRKAVVALFEALGAPYADRG